MIQVGQNSHAATHSLPAASRWPRLGPDMHIPPLCGYAGRFFSWTWNWPNVTCGECLARAADTVPEARERIAALAAEAKGRE